MPSLICLANKRRPTPYGWLGLPSNAVHSSAAPLGLPLVCWALQGPRTADELRPVPQSQAIYCLCFSSVPNHHLSLALEPITSLTGDSRKSIVRRSPVFTSTVTDI